MPVPEPDDEELLTTSRAAKAVGVAARTLQKWVKADLVTPTRITAGGHARWDVADLDRQLRAMRDR